MAVASSIFCALALACLMTMPGASPEAPSLDVSPALPEHIFDVPGPLSAPLSQEEQAAAAVVYPVTVAPTVMPLPFVPLLARYSPYRRRNAGMHPAGADAPVRGRPWVPHVQQVSDTWKRRIPAVDVFQTTPLPPMAPMALLPKPWIVLQYEQPEPIRSFSSTSHTNALQPRVGVAHQVLFVVFAAAALTAFAAKSYRLLHVELGGQASKPGAPALLELGNFPA